MMRHARFISVGPGDMLTGHDMHTGQPSNQLRKRCAPKYERLNDQSMSSRTISVMSAATVAKTRTTAAVGNRLPGPGVVMVISTPVHAVTGQHPAHESRDGFIHDLVLDHRGGVKEADFPEAQASRADQVAQSKLPGRP